MLNSHLDEAEKLALRQVLLDRKAVNQVHKSRLAPPSNINWSSLGLDIFPIYRMPMPRTQREAKDRLAAYVEERESRYDSLKKFLNDNSVSFEASDESIQDVNLFFTKNVYCNYTADDLDLKWFFFAWSYGLFLGNTCIQRAKDIGKKRLWVTTDISIRVISEEPRYVFEIGGDRSKLHNWRPDELIIRIGRKMLKVGDGDPTANGRFPDPRLAFSEKLSDDLKV